MMSYTIKLKRSTICSVFKTIPNTHVCACYKRVRNKRLAPSVHTLSLEPRALAMRTLECLAMLMCISTCIHMGRLLRSGSTRIHLLPLCCESLSTSLSISVDSRPAPVSGHLCTHPQPAGQPHLHKATKSTHLQIAGYSCLQ
jgi:hypothetical protein